MRQSNKILFLTAICITLTAGTSFHAQKVQKVAFYNVENLFDTIDGTNDDAEFLPLAKYQWNSQKYFEKLAHIRQVLLSIGKPMVVGFSEVENASVVRDIIKNQKPFNGEHYDYLMWIDSDIIFNINSFLELIKMDKDIASGWYSQPSGSLSKESFITPVVENMNDEYFKKHGFYQFLSAKEIKDKKEIFKVDYIGFG
jgi:hypothetical protein